MSANEQGKRLAGAHLIFNVATGVTAIVFIHQFISAVDWVSAMTGIRADDFTLKLAVSRNLIAMGETLFSAFNQDLTSAQRAVALNKDELNAVRDGADN